MPLAGTSAEAVFRQMVPDGDDEDNKIEVPLKFWDFYNCGQSFCFT
jgi:hypothetical protein